MKELGHELTPFEEVQRITLDHIEPLGVEERELLDAAGYVLGEDIVAREAIPPFDNAAMDGYAVHVDDIATASEDHPVTLPVRGIIACGDQEQRSLPRGTSYRIMTGAPLPAGSEAVVPHELTRFTDTEVTFVAPIPRQKNIRFAGGDMRPGDVPVKRGGFLRGPQIAVAATLGYRTLKVSGRPSVAILSPGKELVEPWETPGPGQIRNSNAYGLATLVRECGGVPRLCPIIEDDPRKLEHAIDEAIDQGAEMIISTGGVSAGDFDYVKKIVRDHAVPGHVFKTSMRPGKPQVFGLFRGVPLFGLPGNPAAAIVSFTLFVRPALRKMQGAKPWILPTFPVRFGADFAYKGGRVYMLRARVEPDFDHGCHTLAQAGEQDSSFLASLATANAIIELPGDLDGVAAGEVFPAHWIYPR